MKYLREEKLTKKEIALAIVVGIAGAAALFIALYTMPPGPSYKEGRGRVVDKETKERMRYHGVSSIICDGSDCWFYRECKKVRF